MINRVLFLGVFCMALRAQVTTFDLEKITIIDEAVEVNSNLTEDASDFITTEELDQSVAGSMDDVLKNTTGATTTGGPRSSGEAIQVRGLKAAKSYLYLDGARLNFSTDHSSMTAVDPEDLKAVKIYKSSSNFSSAGSLGGGIFLTTKDARDYLGNKSGHGSLLRTGYQAANNEKVVSLKAFTNDKKEKSHYLISATQRLADDSKLADGSILNNSSFKDRSFLFKLGDRITSRTQLDMSLSYFNRNDSVPMNPTLDPPLEELELNGTNEVIRYTISPTLKHIDRHRHLNLYFNPSFTTQSLKKERFGDGQKENRVIRTSGLRLYNDQKLNNFKTRYGLEVNHDKLTGDRDSLTLATYPSGTSQINTIFIDNSLEFKPFTLNFGLKGQEYALDSYNPVHEDKKKSVLLKKIGAEFNLNNKVKTFATYSEGMNAPKVQQVFADGLHHRGDDYVIKDNYFVPNYDLEVETSDTVELGAVVQNSLFSSYDLLSLSYSIYETNAQNYIYFEKKDKFFFEEGAGTTRYVNTPLAKLNGSELTLEYDYEGLKLLANYSEIRGKRVVEGYYLPDLPADTYTFRLSYNFEKAGVTIGYQGLKALLQSRVNPEIVEERTEETPGYFIHSIFASKKFNKGLLKGLAIYTNIENLTDEVYRKHASNIIENGLDIKTTLEYKIINF